MKMRAGAALGAGLILLLTGCGGGSTSSPPVGSSAPPSSSVPSGSTTPSAAATPDANAVPVNAAFSVDLPTGWVMDRLPLSTDDTTSGMVCLHAPGDKKVVFECAGIAIWYGQRLPGAHMDEYAPNVADGWYPATDVQQCPNGPATVKGQINGINPQAGLQKGLRPVGSHQADWNQWTASCTQGPVFHPQAWFLPKSKIVIFDYLNHPETTAVLASAKFGADGDALPVMPLFVTGHEVKASATSITMKVFTTYTNDAKGKAYAKAHGLEYPYLDDYYDAETGKTLTFSIPAGTPCLGNGVLANGSGSVPVACSKFVGQKDLPVGVWVAPGSTTATSLTEVFRP